MLAQSFKTAADLQITEPQKAALMKTLVLLETGKLHHVKDFPPVDDLRPTFSGAFNMTNYFSEHPCGTVCCIAGTAELVGDVKLTGSYYCLNNEGLFDLFLPIEGRRNDITPAQAAIALRSYLTTGDPKWSEAVA